MSKLTDREDRDQRLSVRDTCLRKAVTIAKGLDDITDAQEYNRAMNQIQTLALLSIAITLRDHV